MGYLYILYPQNGDRIVTNDFVTSFHPVYNDEVLATSRRVASISRRLLLLLLLERERISVRRRHASRLSLSASEAPLARRHQDAGGWVGSARCQSNQRTPSQVVNAAASAPAAAAAAAAAAALNRGSLPPPGREWILSGRRSLASSDGPTVCLQLRVIGVRRSDDFHRCCGHHHDKK